MECRPALNDGSSAIMSLLNDPGCLSLVSLISDRIVNTASRWRGSVKGTLKLWTIFLHLLKLNGISCLPDARINRNDAERGLYGLRRQLLPAVCKIYRTRGMVVQYGKISKLFSFLKLSVMNQHRWTTINLSVARRTNVRTLYSLRL